MAVKEKFNAESTQIKWKQIDFRNNNVEAHVKVNIRPTYDGHQLNENDWRCSQEQFVLKPLMIESVLLNINEYFIQNKLLSDHSNESQTPMLKVYIDHCGGIGKRFTSVIPVVFN